MKLELKHLAPYLPYGLRFKYSKESLPIEKMDVDAMKMLLAQYGSIFKKVIHKPILRPLSDLTKQMEIDGLKSIPTFELERIYPEFGFAVRGIATTDIDILKIEITSIPYKMMEQLLKWHFDVFSLIDAGLAIDINTLNKNNGKD